VRELFFWRLTECRNLQIAAAVNVSNQKAARWRKRFLQKGFPRLEKEASRPGRTPTITAGKIEDVVRKAAQGNPTTQPTGVLAPWQRPVASAKRACGGSGTNMA
jgi:transposase